MTVFLKFTLLHHNISMHIFHTVSVQFLWRWKICLTIKSFFTWRSFQRSFLISERLLSSSLTPPLHPPPKIPFLLWEYAIYSVSNVLARSWRHSFDRQYFPKYPPKHLPKEETHKLTFLLPVETEVGTRHQEVIHWHLKAERWVQTVKRGLAIMA